MSSSDSSSSSSSPSPPSSPAANTLRSTLTLEQLVVHFVAAKRSLTSILHGWRANELVTSSRALVEEIAILNAKNAFARRGIEVHVGTLQDIRDEIADAGRRTTDDFKTTIAALDKADARLQDTLKSLRNTVLHESLQRRSAQGPEEDQDEERASPFPSTTNQKTLHDYIDEANHDDILAALRALIDSFQAAHGDFDEDLANLDSTLSTISHKLAYPAAASLHASDSPPSIRTPITTLEFHATSMAGLLQSLISHYDLCVSALKSTEGGGHAALQAAQAEQLPLKNPPASTDNAEESLYLKTVPDPLSAADRAQMLSILTSDADEVADVVTELQDRSADMETNHTLLLAHATQSRTMHDQLRSALQTLHTLRTTALPAHLAALQFFTQTWRSIHAAITTKTTALAELTDFHASFVSAYAKLLDEIDRRAAAETKMRKVADRARRELERLWDLDCEAREGFMEDAGRFLPGDLYPTIGSGARQWTVVREGGEEIQELEDEER